MKNRTKVRKYKRDKKKGKDIKAEKGKQKKVRQMDYLSRDVKENRKYLLVFTLSLSFFKAVVDLIPFQYNLNNSHCAISEIYSNLNHTLFPHAYRLKFKCQKISE